MRLRFGAAAMLLCSVVSALGGAAAISQQIALPDAPGRQQVVDRCTRCHGVDVIIAQPRTQEEWSEVVSVMVGHDAALTDAEYARIVAYLSENLAPQKASSDG